MSSEESKTLNVSNFSDSCSYNNCLRVELCPNLEPRSLKQMDVNVEYNKSFFVTHSYGNCVPFDSSSLDSGTVCDDLFQQGIDYVYIPYTREGGDLTSFLMLIQSANLAFAFVPDRCKREVQLILCHYFLEIQHSLNPRRQFVKISVTIYTISVQQYSKMRQIIIMNYITGP